MNRGYKIVSGIAPPPKSEKGGRPRGSGYIQKMFGRMKQGDSIWEIPLKRFLVFSRVANHNKIKILTRKLPSGNYAIWKL